MSEERRDKLGRRIPTFDRSAAGKKAFATRKKNYDKAHISKSNAIGGSVGKRGYFGTLKDQGREEELKAISIKASQASANRSPEDRRTSVKKAWATRKARSDNAGVRK